MVHDSATDWLEPDDIGAVLDNLASLMEDLHRSDEALQNALSSLAKGGETEPTLFELQHVDLLTQSHFDISNLARCLADWARGRRVGRSDLRASLRLRSLQDRLVDAHAVRGEIEAGELSLF